MIVEMINSGMSSRQVADEMGITVQAARGRIRRLRENGKLPPVPFKHLDNSDPHLTIALMRAKYGTNGGSIRDMIAALTIAEVRWFWSQIPKGMHAGEFAASFIRDAYLEDQT